MMKRLYLSHFILGTVFLFSPWLTANSEKLHFSPLDGLERLWEYPNLIDLSFPPSIREQFLTGNTNKNLYLGLCSETTLLMALEDITNTWVAVSKLLAELSAQASPELLSEEVVSRIYIDLTQSQLPTTHITYFRYSFPLTNAETHQDFLELYDELYGDEFTKRQALPYVAINRTELFDNPILLSHYFSREEVSSFLHTSPKECTSHQQSKNCRQAQLDEKEKMLLTQLSLRFRQKTGKTLNTDNISITLLPPGVIFREAGPWLARTQLFKRFNTQVKEISSPMEYRKAVADLAELWKEGPLNEIFFNKYSEGS